MLKLIPKLNEDIDLHGEKVDENLYNYKLVTVFMSLVLFWEGVRAMIMSHGNNNLYYFLYKSINILMRGKVLLKEIISFITDPWLIYI